MTKEEIKEIFNQYDIFDKDILEHGFTKNNRDYKIIIRIDESESYEFNFIGCVELVYQNILLQQNLFLDEIQTTEQNKKIEERKNENYSWVNYSVLYPGIEIFENSEITQKWENKFNSTFHQIKITTNVFELTIIFNRIKVKQIKTV